MNTTVITSSSGGDIGIWRTDCSGDLSAYTGVADLYCVAIPNSTGVAAVTGAVGSYLVSDNNVTLQASNLPPNEFGFFLVSPTTDFNPVGAGILCLGSPQGRYNQTILNSGATGTFSLAIDLTILPLNPPTPVMSGDTYNFQAWSRDGGTSNFSQPIGITFL